jgi:hypothetical protein
VASRPVVFDKYSFPSVSRAKAECKRIRDKYAEGEVVSDPADDAFFRALVAEHRNREEKIGDGIQHFVVARNNSLGARAGNLGIWIKQVCRQDLVDFGYGGVMEWIADPGNARQERRRVQRALRNAIRVVTDEYLSNQLNSGQVLKSCLTGRILKPTQRIDVVHDLPRWGDLVDEFVATRGGCSAIRTRQTERSLGEILEDEDTRASWSSFTQVTRSLDWRRPKKTHKD